MLGENAPSSKSSARRTIMKSHKVRGGAGVQLHVVETGNPKGRPILFIHGVSQSWLTWTRQLDSKLADNHRLVAIDMRGHGQSDKPQDAYGDSKLWADDINAVIQELKLDHPVLSGWSYGPLLALDYIRHYGEDQIGGIQFVGGVSKLGSQEAIAVLTPEFLGVVPQFLSPDSETCARGLEGLLRLCFAQQPSAAELKAMLEYNVSVPAYVRQGMFSRSFDNDDLMPRIRKPVLLTHGAADGVVKPAVVEQHKAAMPHAQVQLMPNLGHGPFWEDAPAFNERLHAFCESC
jgi:pimeloyl-ACP methyl ester carboxylesterase